MVPRRRWVAPVAGEVDERRTRHAAQRRNCRQRRARPARELALDNLALDLEPDEHEEDRHQAVIHPQQQRLLDAEAAEPDGDRQARAAEHRGPRAASSPARARPRQPGTARCRRPIRASGTSDCCSAATLLATRPAHSILCSSAEGGVDVAGKGPGSAAISRHSLDRQRRSNPLRMPF